MGKLNDKTPEDGYATTVVAKKKQLKKTSVESVPTHTQTHTLVDHGDRIDRRVASEI